jgi:hypothetical protein
MRKERNEPWFHPIVQEDCMMNDSNHDPDGKYTECYVAFLDILGFKKLVNRSEKNTKVLSALIDGLTKMANLRPPTVHEKRYLQYRGAKCVGVGNMQRWVTQVRAFSDCVAIFIPTETQALADILRKVRYLHDGLLERHSGQGSTFDILNDVPT